MHYKNGRAAKEGDAVIGQAWLGTQRVIAGTIYNLQAGSVSCNAQVAVPVPGGTYNTCITVGEFVHAEDAFDAAVPKPVISAGPEPEQPPQVASV